MKNIYYLLFLLILPVSITAQKVFIDQPIRIGEFIVFPTVDDPNVYHYFPGNPRIAKTKDGKPQFSFLLYTEKNRSKADAESIEDQAGGGLVHALVEYGLTDREVEQLRGALKAKNKSAILKGPIFFKSGNIAMISAVGDGSSGHVKKVIGVGKAPILEGNKAAIAFMLDKKGAQILWATFQTPTPDISFSFEMEMAGYLSPIKGYVKGNFKDVYEAHDMSLGVSGGIGPISLGAEIGATLDKLEKDGKIEVYTEGDDKERDKLIEYGYKKLVDMLFVSTDESYNQMVNNDPSKKESGFDKLEELSKLQSKFNTDSEKGESYDNHKNNRKTSNSTKSESKPKKSEESPAKKEVMDPFGEGGNNRLGYFNEAYKKNKQIYFRKQGGGVSAGNKYRLEFLDNILNNFENQERSIYESKHNDLVSLRYRERWTTKNPVKVSKKHIIAILNNYKKAQSKSENSTVKGRKWIRFYPQKGNVKEVTMEAWRFRGLVDMTYSNKVRNNLKRMINEVEVENDIDLGPTVEVSTGSENLASLSEAFDEDYEEINKRNLVSIKYRKKWADPNGNQDISVSRYHTLAILDNCQQASRLLEKFKGNRWVRMKPNIGNYDSFEIEYWRFGGLVDICSNKKAADFVREKLNKKRIISDENEDCGGLKPYSGSQILATTSEAFDLSYTEENKEELVTVRFRKKWSDKDGNQDVRVSKEHAIAILDNYKQAACTLQRYKGKLWVRMIPEIGSHKAFDMEYWRFGGLVDICTYSDEVRNSLRKMIEEEMNVNKLNKRKRINKGGPNSDNYFNYDDYLNELSEKEFLNQIPIVNPASTVKGTPMGISIYASYKYRKTKKEGTYKLEFKKVKAETRHLRFDENIGNILKECKECFNVVSLDEMKHFKQREVLALLDGAVLSNFNNFINSASIQLKKIRPNGSDELDDATIKYTDFNKVGDIDKKVTGNIRKLVYGWKNDKDETWGNYKYKIDWTYFSNLKIPGEWKDADANVITVSSPLNLKTLTIEADPDFAEENGIKYIIVNIEYPYGDKMQRGYVDFDEGGEFMLKVIKLKPSSGILSKKIGVILPNDVDEVSYTYTVITKDNEEFTSKPKKAKGLYIYGIDRIPKGK